MPTPNTWLIGHPMRAEPLLDGGPLIVKPHRGHRGAGVHLVTDTDALSRVPESGVPLSAQRHVPGPGEDLKVYVAGSRVWAVRKAFDEESFTRPGRPVPVSDEVCEIARRIG